MRKEVSLSRFASVLFLSIALAGAQAQSYRVIYSFNSNDGSPSGIALAPGGNLIGMTSSGGNFGNGTIFALNLSGGKTVLHSFQTADGYNPFNAPLVDQNGTVYGTTVFGGAYGDGTVFRLDSAGNFTVLYSFGAVPNDGYSSISTLVKDSNGNLYGTTQAGGTDDDGTVFKLDASSNETILHSFHFYDGLIPRAGVYRDASGNLFGTTGFGGVGVNFLCGVVYKIDNAGNFSVLHYFNCVLDTDGSDSWSLLTGDAAGNLYGTTAQGGIDANGTAFEMDGTGIETTLHNFSGPDGAEPFGNLLKDATGNTYGTTAVGGAANSGILFRLDSSEIETILHTFTGQNGDGAGPRDLIMDAAGDLFGATAGGGGDNLGTVFEYSAPPSTAVPSMISYVNSLYAQRVVNGGQDNSLVKQLDQVAKLIAAGKLNAAISNIDLVIAEVNDLRSSGVLTPQQAAPLLAGANSLIATL